VSRVSGSAELRRSFHEARLALEAAAAAVRLLARGRITATGALPPERCVDPEDLFPELERGNCRFSTEVDALR